MSLQNRLARLEQVHPQADTREPLLVEFISYDDDDTEPELAGILYEYNGQPERRLNRQELEQVKNEY